MPRPPSGDQATAPALPAAGDLEAFAMFARIEKAPVTCAVCIRTQLAARSVYPSVTREN
jgi:hypothetical protein